MSKVYICDQCKNKIADEDIRITLIGYDVIQNREKVEYPQGYRVMVPRDFCSFNCVSNWAAEQQNLLDNYNNTVCRHDKEGV